MPETEQESWEDTKKFVANAIADVCNINVAEAAEQLERVLLYIFCKYGKHGFEHQCT